MRKTSWHAVRRVLTGREYTVPSNWGEGSLTHNQEGITGRQDIVPSTRTSPGRRLVSNKNFGMIRQAEAVY